MKRWLFTFLKLAVSGGLLVFMLSRVDLKQFWALGSGFPLWFFVPITVLFMATIPFGSWRWKIILSIHGVEQSIRRGIYLYLVGYFFNNFLPTSIGGDLMRGIEAGRPIGATAAVFGSILIERILGVLATLSIALVFLPFYSPPHPLPLLVLALNTLFWTIILIFLFIKTDGLLDWVLRFTPSVARKKINEVVDAVRMYRDDRKRLVQAFAVSLLYQGIIIFVIWCIAQVSNVTSVPLQAYFIFVPLISIISLMPLCVNALGVREAGYVYFFTLVGAPKEHGLLVSLIFFGTMVAVGVVGGVAWGVTGRLSAPGVPQA